VTLVVVTGTGTEVGKTYVTAALARAMKANGTLVHARKPVQSFAPHDATTDADELAAATGEPPEQVCPADRRLPTPMAPPMAAEALGLPAFTIADLVQELAVPARGLTLVEGAGGLLSPLAADGDTRTLIDACNPDVVLLVADAGLGTINVVRLSVAALGARQTVVFLNRFDPRDDVHARNAAWLRAQDGLEIVTDLEALVTRLQDVISRRSGSPA
jgi:dethiobiotin synthetase